MLGEPPHKRPRPPMTHAWRTCLLHCRRPPLECLQSSGQFSERECTHARAHTRARAYQHRDIDILHEEACTCALTLAHSQNQTPTDIQAHALCTHVQGCDLHSHPAPSFDDEPSCSQGRTHKTFHSTIPPLLQIWLSPLQVQ